MPTLARPDIDLHYEDSGSGPPLLLVAGLACDSMSWLPVAAPLARSFRLIRPDNRGVGRTRPQDAASSIEAMADDCAALIRHLGLRRVHLLGHSMGAFIARRLAVRHPDLVDRLVLAACGEAAGARNLALFRDLADDYPPASDPARWHRRLYSWIFTRGFFEDPAKLDAATRWALDSPYPQSAAGFRRQVDAMANDDAAASDASRIAARTLILIGREDLLFPIASAQRFAATIAGARLAIVEDAAHALHTERPDAFVAAVAEFLGR